MIRTQKLNVKIIQYVLLILVAIIMLFPIMWMFSSSLKTLIGISQFPPEFFPSNPQWGNFIEVFRATNVLQYAQNSLILIIGNTVGTLLSSSLVAYPLARMDFRGKNLVFALIMATMMVPATTTIIPQYFIFSHLNWLNSMRPLIIPAFFAFPYNVFLIRQFYRGIPTSLDEAATIDGCNHWQIFWKVIVPISKPTYITIGVLSAVFWWNELFTPLIYLDSDRLKPLALGALTAFRQASFITQWHLTMALSILMIIPPIVLYLIANKYLVEGIKTSGLKG
jgi:multiple sugar transport system permease protein